MTHVKARLFATVVTVLVVLAPHNSEAAPTAPAAAAHKTPIVQMGHISVETVGKGPPVVLIPGLSMSRENWRATAERLAPHHTVHLVQINGFGDSAGGANLQPGIVPGVVADLHAYIARQRIAGAAVVGHSLGGSLAIKLAHDHPGDVGRLMIVDALPWVALIMAPPTATVAQVEPQARAMRDRIAATYGTPVDPVRERAQMAVLALKPASQDKAIAWSHASDRRVTAQAFYEDMILDMRGDMAGLTMPVTLVYPWSAAGVSKATADALYHAAFAKVPNMRFVDVAESGHFVMLDQPETFDAALDAFLR